MLQTKLQVSVARCWPVSGCLQRLLSSVIFFAEPKLQPWCWPFGDNQEYSFFYNPWWQLSATAGGKFPTVAYSLQLAAAKTGSNLFYSNSKHLLLITTEERAGSCQPTPSYTVYKIVQYIHLLSKESTKKLVNYLPKNYNWCSAVQCSITNNIFKTEKQTRDISLWS